jgi:hypothetical protein
MSKNTFNVNSIVIAGGKCGSSTLCNTLNNNNINSLKIHSRGDYKKQFNYDGIFETIELSSKNKKLYLIDSYRTPIERKISSFFENINKYVPNFRNKTIDELINIFNQNFLRKIENYHFINNIFNYYNIEPFNSFDFNKRYVIKEVDNKVFIKILFKDIKNWNKILSSIFNKNIIIHNNNISNTKAYFNIYNEFKNKYIVPKEYLENELINDKEFLIYNTIEEQEIYINEWLKKSC